MKRYLGMYFSMCLTLCGAFTGVADVTLKPEVAGNKAVVVENESIKMVVDPLRGGRVVSFIHKPAGKEIVIRDSTYMGLFADHLWSQGFPGELMEAAYEMTPVKTGPDEVVLKLWREIKGEWMSVKKKTLEGLIIEKTFTVKAGVDSVSCHVSIKNPTKEGRLADYWAQNVFYIGGTYHATQDVFYRPSCRGVKAGIQGSEEYLRDPYSGWSAAVDRETGQGLAWITDYNYLDMLYNNGGNQTLEWMYDKMPIPPGKEWQTDIVLVPLHNMDNISHASTSFVAGLEVKREGNKVLLLHQFRSLSGNVADFTVAAEFYSISDNRKTSIQPLKVGTLSTEVRSVSQTADVAIANPMMVTIVAIGKANGKLFRETYLVFYSGGCGFGGENLRPDLITPLYKVDRPEKQQVLIKPENIARNRQGHPSVFVIEGLFADHYRIRKALHLFSVDPASGYGYYSQTGYAGSNVTDFLFDYETLMRQDVIIVANANVQCLGKLGLEMLRDYVTHGGSLLFLGGKASYGAGGLNGSGLEDLLPVEVEPNFGDIKRTSNATIILADPHSITRNLNLSDKPFCLYLHKVKVKNDANVILKAGDMPFLVVKEIKGGGRVACFLGAPYGPDKGNNLSTSFCSWKEWPLLLKNVMTWLSNRE